jgi:hypothetical protein
VLESRFSGILYRTVREQETRIEEASVISVLIGSEKQWYLNAEFFPLNI